MKTTILLGFVLAATATSGSASAEAPAPPRYSQLPSGTPTFVPTKGAPRSVPHAATTPGLFFEKADRMGNQNVVEVLGVPTRATDRPQTADETETCFAEMSSDALDNARQMHGDSPADWGDASFASEVQLYKRSSDFPTGGVTAVHLERFEEKNGNASIAMTDAWADPATRGARTFAQKSLPLALVATSAYGLRVFAVRDDRAKEKLVQFVVVPDEKQRADGQSSRLGVTSDGHRMARSQCGHLRISLPVADEGASAQILANVIVGDAKPDPNVVVSGASGQLRGKHRRIAEAGEKHRFRPLAVQVSVSKTARDPEPVVSVSFGWAARETSQRFF